MAKDDYLLNIAAAHRLLKLAEDLDVAVERIADAPVNATEAELADWYRNLVQAETLLADFRGAFQHLEAAKLGHVH